MRTADDVEVSTVVDRLVEHALSTLPDQPEIETSLRQYYSHVDESDLQTRRVEDLFGLAMDHLALAWSWEDGEVAIQVANPRVELDGWGSDHTIVQIVTEDIPVLVDGASPAISS